MVSIVLEKLIVAERNTI